MKSSNFVLSKHLSSLTNMISIDASTNMVSSQNNNAVPIDVLTNNMIDDKTNDVDNTVANTISTSIDMMPITNSNVILHAATSIGNYTYDIATASGDSLSVPINRTLNIEHLMNDTSHFTLLNITNELPIEYAQPMYGYIMPFLLIITIVANTLIVVVLSKRHMRTPTNVVLMAMALCDMFTLLFPAPWLFYMYTFGNHYKPLAPVGACYAWMIMQEVLPALFHTASIWLTLALALQRYIYVCHAATARVCCTMDRVIKALIAIAILAVLHQSTRFFDRDFIETPIPWNGRTEQVCKVKIAEWVDKYISQNVYFTIYYCFRAFFVNIIPCVSLVVLNALLFRALREARRRREILFKENRKSECKKLRESNCTTLMLIVVVSVFLIVEIPLAVVTILHIISSVTVEILDYEIANKLILITNFLIIVSYPINFAIYCGMSRQFRETFKELFIRGVVVNKRNGGSSRYSLVNGPRTSETVL